MNSEATLWISVTAALIGIALIIGVIIGYTYTTRTCEFPREHVVLTEYGNTTEFATEFDADYVFDACQERCENKFQISSCMYYNWTDYDFNGNGELDSGEFSTMEAVSDAIGKYLWGCYYAEING